MRSSRQVNYFRVGTFVITGISLIVIAILLFGSGLLFKRVVYVETYFSESVQGLTDGSPVKYLGMEIGTVSEIAAIDSIYPLDRTVEDRKHNRYIYVKMAINPKFFLGRNADEIKQELERDINTGLRVKLALQGLTGNTYLELDFLDPKNNPVLPIYWIPRDLYIPSTTSTLAYFSDNVQYILRELRNVNIQKIFDNIESTTDSAKEITYKVDRLLANANRPLVNAINNLNHALANINGLSEQTRAFPSYTLFGKPPKKLNPGAL